MSEINYPAIYNGNAVEVLPDSDRYKCRFKVRSGSSNSLHLISFDSAPGAGYWTCSCRGNISHGDCKHLKAVGVMGRKLGNKMLITNSMR